MMSWDDVIVSLIIFMRFLEENKLYSWAAYIPVNRSHDNRSSIHPITLQYL